MKFLGKIFDEIIKLQIEECLGAGEYDFQTSTIQENFAFKRQACKIVVSLHSEIIGLTCNTT